MNHFLLPGPLNGKPSLATAVATNYGLWSMEVLLNGMYKMGSVKQDLIIKVFGGGNLLQGVADIGQRNITFVREFIAREELAFVVENTGGNCVRKLYFSPNTGQVYMKRIDHDQDIFIVEQDSKFMKKVLSTTTQNGEVDLF